MNQNIADYLQKNKALYAAPALVEQLLKAGYERQAIDEAVAAVFNEAAAVQPAKPKNGFWDFRSVKTYSSGSEKRKDFFFGLFAPMVLGFGLNLVMSFLLPYAIRSNLTFLQFVLVIAAMIYFFRRRKYIFYGLIAGPLLGLLSILIIAVIAFGYLR